MKAEQKYNKNSPPVLVCKADGNPKPSVVWYKGNEKVTDKSGEISSDRLTLKVKSPDALKTTIYRCLVKNRFGNISYHFVLTTSGKLQSDCSLT